MSDTTPDAEETPAEETPLPTDQIVPAKPRGAPPTPTEGPAPVEGVKVEGGKGLKYTVAVEVDAGGLSGDLGQYADTSWSLTSSRGAGVMPRQAIGLGDATVSKRLRNTYSKSLGLLHTGKRMEPTNSKNDSKTSHAW